MKILMVCLGNICRSPLAEGILKNKIKELELNWKVDSAGTSNYHNGNSPDMRSIKVGFKHGIDISNQRARLLKSEDLQEFDYIMAMDASNYNNIKKIASSKKQIDKIQLIMNLAYPGENRQIPDPYWDNDGFEKVYQMLEHACSSLIETILQKHKN